LSTIDLILDKESLKSFRISDFVGDTVDTTNMESVVDRLRRLMGIISDNNNNRNITVLPDAVPSITELTSPINHNDDYNFNPVVRRRISQYPQVNIPNLGDYLSDSDVLGLNNEPTLSRNIGIITGSPGNIDHADSLSNHLTYWDHPTPNLATEHDVRPITSFTGGTINY
jgi:hypothetical protein